jgi:hypothetical protein
MPYTIDGFNFHDHVNYTVTAGPQLGMVERTLFATTFGVRPGGAIAGVQDGIGLLPLRGEVYSTSMADVEAKLDTLKRWFRRPNARLVATNQADRRFAVVNLERFDAARKGRARTLIEYTAVFRAADPYLRADVPFSDVRSPALTLLPGETTARVAEWSLTPGGTVPAPLRMVITNQNGSVTPTSISITNRSLLRLPLWKTPLRLAPNQALVIDPEHEGAIWCNLASVRGWWIFQGTTSAEAVQDFSGRGRDLTPVGNPEEGVDGVFGAAARVDGIDDYWTQADVAFDVTSAWTILVRYTPRVVNTNQGLLSRARTDRGYGLRLTSAGVLEAAQRPDAASRRIVTGTIPVQAGVPLLAAATWDGTTLQLYNQGELDRAVVTATGGTTAGENNLLVGAAHRVDGGALEVGDGVVHEAAVLDVALTAEQMRRVERHGLAAYLNTVPRWAGQLPALDPTLIGLSGNVIQLRADHATTGANLRVATSGRARWS